MRKSFVYWNRGPANGGPASMPPVSCGRTVMLLTKGVSRWNQILTVLTEDGFEGIDGSAYWPDVHWWALTEEFLP